MHVPLYDNQPLIVSKALLELGRDSTSARWQAADPPWQEHPSRLYHEKSSLGRTVPLENRVNPQALLVSITPHILE